VTPAIILDARAIVVTHADREAAASGYFAWIGSNPVVPAKMRAGEADDHSIVQAFARHRIAAQADLLAACMWAESALAPFSKSPAEKSGIANLRLAIAKAKGGAA